MTRRSSVGLGILSTTIGLAALGVLALSPLGRKVFVPNDPAYSRLQLFGEALAIVRDRYVDRPDDSKLVGAAIRGMLRALDPHSGYVDGNAYAAMQSMTNGEVGDPGVELTLRAGEITVISPIDGSSAAKVGIRSGDVIASIGGHSTQGMTVDQAREKIRGEPNTSVRVEISRGIPPQILSVDLVRDQIKIRSVRSRLEPGGIGYIRVAQFTEISARDARAAMEAFAKKIAPSDFKGYILDLRNNPGGFFDQAIETVNAFVDEGEIVSTRGRAPGTNQTFSARPGLNISGGKPVVVLINGATASAAEIVAGALQDIGRAIVVGTRSFGKGTAQTTIPLGADGALRMTTALFFTPSGRSIQAAGVQPNIEVLQDVPDDAAGRYRTSGEASLKGHLPGFEAEAFGSQAYVPTDPDQDIQLRAARDILLGTR